MILDEALNRIGARGTLQRGLSYYTSRTGNLLRRCLSDPGLAEDRVPLRPQTMSHRQRLDNLFR